MLRILLRADDLGYSEGVNCGLAWACDNGLPMNVGLMVNLPGVRHGWELIAEKDYCLGMHATISAGEPTSDPTAVPSLVDETGRFRSSGFYRSAASDPATLDDVECEVEAQFRAFVELVGREPDYLDVHAVGSANFVIGTGNVASRHGKPFSYLAPSGQTMHVGSSNVLLHSSTGDLKQIIAGVIAADAQAPEPVVHALMLHPGFVDAQLMRGSSLTLPRTVDAEILRSPELQAFADRGDVELVTYRDL